MHGSLHQSGSSKNTTHHSLESRASHLPHHPARICDRFRNRYDCLLKHTRPPSSAFPLPSMSTSTSPPNPHFDLTGPTCPPPHPKPANKSSMSCSMRICGASPST
ncbi:hypothetical protein M438DRAFT_17345 [Aureobasidium pullulans EXF-150]|uniref:Uncharacterized protein n=1 Tax=Aureobasidium pullulans EXF-150 TaxID=1043002 RepID=A0A074Y201_AURPU|nr:uncharacterized protein M438DRAFT_17345 [Aureobasidium pullulans EXF-150]KEQ89954.1 hypothetical protein M438DRAFT_17345 [Aureobasidium pullulans EXF-150]